MTQGHNKALKWTQKRATYHEKTIKESHKKRTDRPKTIILKKPTEKQ